MSSAEPGVTLRDAVAAVQRELNARNADDDAGHDVSQADAAALLAAAVRVYTTCAEEPYETTTLATLAALTPTQACTAAAALLRSQSLTPFEFGIWYSGSRAGRVADRDS